MVSQDTFDLYFKGQIVLYFFLLQLKSVYSLNLNHAMKSNVRTMVYSHLAITISFTKVIS